MVKNMKIKKERKILTSNLSKITLLYEKYAESYGLTYNSIVLYYALEYYGECTQKQIAEEWAIPKQTVNYIVKKSIKDGLVEFIDKEVKKNKRIRFTKKGKEKFSKIINELMCIEEEVMENMGELNLEKLIKGSESFLYNFELVLKERLKI